MSPPPLSPPPNASHSLAPFVAIRRLSERHANADRSEDATGKGSDAWAADVETVASLGPGALAALAEHVTGRAARAVALEEAWMRVPPDVRLKAAKALRDARVEAVRRQRGDAHRAARAALAKSPGTGARPAAGKARAVEPARVTGPGSAAKMAAGPAAVGGPSQPSSPAPAAAQADSRARGSTRAESALRDAIALKRACDEQRARCEEVWRWPG